MTHVIAPEASISVRDRLFPKLSCVLLCLALFFSFSRAEGTTMIMTDSSSFNIFGTVTGANHIYVEPATFSTIGQLSTFDSSLGILTGVKVYASFVGSYSILSHCNYPFCDFTTYGGFYDGFSYSPPGSSFSANGYAMSINLSPPSPGFGGSSMSRSGNTHFSEQVVINPIYFDQYLDTAGDYVLFTKNGNQYPKAHIWHENNLSAALPFLEACIDDCDEKIGLVALGVWLATQDHGLLYNDTHFKYSGSRFFQVDYTYEPFPSTVPVPPTTPLLVIGLGLIAYMERRRKRPNLKNA